MPTIFLVGGPACGNSYEIPEATDEFHIALVPLARSPMLAPHAAVPVDLTRTRRAIYAKDDILGEVEGRFRYVYVETGGG